jgi:hypothetical protein
MAKLRKPRPKPEKDRDTPSQVTVSSRGFLKLCDMANAGRFTIYSVRVMMPGRYRCHIARNYK